MRTSNTAKTWKKCYLSSLSTKGQTRPNWNAKSSLIKSVNSKNKNSKLSNPELNFSNKSILRNIAHLISRSRKGFQTLDWKIFRKESNLLLVLRVGLAKICHSENDPSLCQAQKHCKVLKLITTLKQNLWLIHTVTVG